MNGYNFSDRARILLQIARDEAARLRHDYVAPEHLLLAMTREVDGVAAAALTELGVNLDEVRRRVEGDMKPGSAASPGPDFPYTSLAKKVLEGAIDEARTLKHNYVGTEHLLLSLLRLQKAPAVAALAGLGVTLDGTRTVVLRLLGAPEIPYVAGRAHAAASSLARLALLLSVIALAVALCALVLAVAQP